MIALYSQKISAVSVMFGLRTRPKYYVKELVIEV